MDLWPKKWSTYLIETVVIVSLAIFSMSLDYGRWDIARLPQPQLTLRMIGSLCIWFANRFMLEYLLQSRIDANKVTQYLPFEMTLASVALTSMVYLILYPIFLYLNNQDFGFGNLLQGLFLTCGLSLLIVIFYAAVQIWQSWWSDGEFLFQTRNDEKSTSNLPEYITIRNAKGSVDYDLRNVAYFMSESKIVFMVDTAGKRWMTQYNLSELEEILGARYFRLNRSILVSRQVIGQVKKLPNHRLLVTLGEPSGAHTEVVSRYKSTRFKRWLESTKRDHSV